MQDLVGIVRTEAEMQQALDGSPRSRQRAAKRRRRRQPRVQPGLAHGARPAEPADRSEAITRVGLERKESRGGHFRDDYPDKDAAFGKFNIVVRKERSDGERCESCAREPICRPMPRAS